MQDINLYIIEKLRINNDTKLGKDTVNVTTEHFSKGDLCFIIKDRGLKNQERVLIDVVKILKRTKCQLSYEYVTTFNNHGSNIINFPRYNIDPNKYNYPYISTMSATTYLVPHNDCDRILDIIKRNNLCFDFDCEMYNKDNYSLKPLYVPVMKLKQGKESWEREFNSFEKITEEDLRTLEKALRQ